MNKRNTEGYVLAYLLIVITVMGVIAATLMTSTLQVVQAQEKSLVYMKDKYEVQGELERFISDLSNLIATSSFSNDGFLSQSSAEDAAAQDLSDYLNDREKFNFDDYPFISTETNDENELVEKFHANHNSIADKIDTLSFCIEFSNGSIVINAVVTIHLKIDIVEYEKEDTPDNLATPDTNEYTSHDEYKYTINNVDFLTFDSYNLTINGGDT